MLIILHNVLTGCITIVKTAKKKKKVKQLPNRAISHDLEKWFRYVGVRHLFYQPMDEKIKTWPLRFPAK